MLARSTWLALALAALGLWASLVPQVTYPSASSGDPAGDVLIAWPGWGVQQDLGPVSGTLGRFQIWVSAEPDWDDVTVWASLVDASSKEVLRQTFIEAAPGYIPVPRTLTFPSYDVPEGQRLLLQLQVQLPEQFHVIYRLAGPRAGVANVMVNGVPDSGSGPLAFAHLATGSGLRAAVVGEPAERGRLVLSVVLSVLAVLSHPRVAAGLRRIGMKAWLGAQRPVRRLAGHGALGAETHAGGRPTLVGRFLATPWYPWPAAAIPILHFLASNPLHFAPIESVLPLAVALVVVTGAVVGLRLVLKDWHRSSAATAAITVVFFAYGHVERALVEISDERVLFAGAVVLVAAAVVLVIRAAGLPARGTPFLNLTAAVLLAFPAASLAGEIAASSGRTPTNQHSVTADVVDRLLPSGLPTAIDNRPDVYYIILDEYARHDTLDDYDNSTFLRQLESRGFYVAYEATSNYVLSTHSIPSSLNMLYLDDIFNNESIENEDLISIARNHALGRILKSLGYEYIHLDSGFLATKESPLADTMVTFSPAGTLVNRNTDRLGGSYAEMGDPIAARPFVRSLIQTTALNPIIGNRYLLSDRSPYSFYSSRRTLDMFEFLTNPIESEGPKFVFAHMNKPHTPATFDRHGNYIESDSPTVAFRNHHDPTVPSPYIGQVIYINSLVLKMIDGILQQSDHAPIIVIAADHGKKGPATDTNATLAAFHLPNGGNASLYPSISSVNHFRYILDYYFDLNLGLLEDRVI